MVYHEVTLGPSEGQLMSLANGEKVSLAHDNFEGDVPFHLTTAQVKRIAAAHAAGKGCTLKLSAAQVKRHGMQGSGRFGDLIRAGWDYAKPMAQDLASQGVDAGLRYGAQKVGDYAKDKLGLRKQGKGFFGSVIRGGVDGGLNAFGLGAQQQGEGFFGNVIRGGVDGGLNAFGLGANVARPPPPKIVMSDCPPVMVAVPVTGPQQGKGFFGSVIRGGVNGGLNAFGLGAKQKKKSTGKGLKY